MANNRLNSGQHLLSFKFKTILTYSAFDHAHFNIGFKCLGGTSRKPPNASQAEIPWPTVAPGLPQLASRVLAKSIDGCPSNREKTNFFNFHHS
jgi:hypothetical protein